jgi:Fe-S cluster assembly protein SufD
LAKLALDSAVIPRESDELWRYSGIDRFQLVKFVSDVLPEQVASTTIEISPAAIAAGVSVMADESVNFDETYFGAVGGAYLSSALVVSVPANVEIVDPIRICTLAQAAGVSGSQVRIVLGVNASATVIEEFRSTADHDGAALIVYSTVFALADGSRLQHASVQLLADQDWAVGSLRGTTGRDASLSSVAVALGGKYARLETSASAVASGAHNELLAVYFAGNDQVHDFRTRQHHIAPRTTSDLLFKGAVEDSARSVYSGMIHIGKDARRTVANQTNRNLLLSPGASAESVPNLEIENNDVKCSHASAIGPIDDDHRYYLESRGVPPSQADRLIVLGFFADLLDRVPDASLRAELVAAVGEKFDRRALQESAAS